jgi:small subunit ribosomal protein S17
MESISQRGVRKTREGIVVSDAMDKTIVVSVERRYRHPVYSKELRQYKKYHAHDEKNEAHTGDVVRIEETRPISRMKRWRLVEVLRKGKSTVSETANDSAQN